MMNLSTIKTIKQLSRSLRADAEFEQQFKADPSKVLREIDLTGVPDTRVYHIVVASLGAAVLVSVLGAIAIALIAPAREIPDILVVISSAAVGALAGLLTARPS